MAESPEIRGRRALLVGIDRYPNLGLEWQLEGCGNDVAILQNALICRFGFEKDLITVLRDEQATRVAIRAAMDALVHRAEKDEEVVFFSAATARSRPTATRTTKRTGSTRPWWRVTAGETKS